MRVAGSSGEDGSAVDGHLGADGGGDDGRGRGAGPPSRRPGATPVSTQRVVSAAMAAVARRPSPVTSSATAMRPSGATTSAQAPEPVPVPGGAAGRRRTPRHRGRRWPAWPPRGHRPGRATSAAGRPEGQDRGAAAQRLPDHLAVAVGDGALGEGLLDRLRAHRRHGGSPAQRQRHGRGRAPRPAMPARRRTSVSVAAGPKPAPVTSATPGARACSSRSSRSRTADHSFAMST